VRLSRVGLGGAEALLPYGASKAGPDEGPPNVVPVVGAPAPGPGQARDVTPRALSGHQMMPADVAYEIEQNQQVSAEAGEASDAEIRTEGPSD